MRILGIDYGRKKIGLAVGDTVTKLSEPLKVFSISKACPEPAEGFKVQSSKLIKENEIGKIVIGLPSGLIDEEIKKFGRILEKDAEVPVEFFDETLTTLDAQEVLRRSGTKKKWWRKKEDAVAAAIMLQYYLETRLC